MYLALENNILVCAAAAHEVLRDCLRPYMLLCLAGMAINSLLALDWCTSCVVTQIHPKSLCPHVSPRAGSCPTNHPVLVSLPASDGLADPKAVSCRGSAGRWASMEMRKRDRRRFPPQSLCDNVHLPDLQPCTISSPSRADSVLVAAQPFCTYLCSST